MPKTGFAFPTGYSAQVAVEVAQASEAQGYESFWLTEGGGKDSISQLAYIAGQTTSIKLGTAIITIFGRTPVLIAQTSMSLDELSGGRFILGLGTGHQASVENHQGQSFVSPGARMVDYINVIRTLLSNGRVVYQGKAVSVAEFRMAGGGGLHVPIYLATLGGPLARTAGRLGQGVLPLMANPAGIERLCGHIAEGAKQVGRDPSDVDVACMIIACASDDEAAAEAEARRQVARYGSLPFYQKMLRLGGFEQDVDRFVEAQNAGEAHRLPELVSDRMLEEVTLLGPVDRWRSTLAKFRAAGVTQPIIYAAAVGNDHRGSLLQAVLTLTAEDLS